MPARHAARVKQFADDWNAAVPQCFAATEALSSIGHQLSMRLARRVREDASLDGR
jgi:hypothetical protein